VGIWYCTREDIMSAQDIKATAYSGPAIDAAIEAASRSVEGLLHRTFYPWTGTRSFDTPNWDRRTRAGRIWLAPFDLASVSSITTQNGAVSVPTASVFLEPQEGPPYEWVEIDRSTNAAWAAGTTNQRATAITGVYCGCAVTEVPAGTLAEPLDASETLIDGSSMPLAGVGTILRVDSERMVVTDKSWLTTGQTTSLGTQNNNVTAAVSDGTKFAAGETLLIDSERVLVVDVAGNTLTVKRAVQGSVLASHTTATIFAPRTLTVERGVLGTTAATHADGAAVVRYLVPGGVQQLAQAYAVNNILQAQSGYARTAGSGDNEREINGKGITALEKAAVVTYGRRARTGAI
jgi:hypothetical protein